MRCERYDIAQELEAAEKTIADLRAELAESQAHLNAQGKTNIVLRNQRDKARARVAALEERLQQIILSAGNGEKPSGLEMAWTDIQHVIQIAQECLEAAKGSTEPAPDDAIRDAISDGEEQLTDYLDPHGNGGFEGDVDGRS